MPSELSFGAQYAALDNLQDRLTFELAENRRVAFADVDAVVDSLVLRALLGDRVVKPLSAKRSQARLVLTDQDNGEALAEHFALKRQQARGAWYAPKANRLEVGLVHLAYWQKTKPRYLLTFATEEVATAAFEQVDSVVIWAALEPLFDALSLPLRLRAGRWAGEKTAEKQQPYWTKSIEPVYSALGFSAEAARAFAPNTGWADLHREQVQARRAALLGPWSSATAETAARLRTLRIGQLVDRYYAKAKNGKALRSRVMNDRGAERTLTTYFGGDWLALLEYLGEEPHADEQVTRTLPQTRLMVTSSERVASVAAEHGLPPEEVERMVAAFWGQSDGSSPPEQRVRVLKRFWHEFDETHARQAPGMKEPRGIWGSGYADEPGTGTGPRGDSGFSDELLRDVRRLWGTKLNARYPEKLVTEPSCRTAASQAFGAALLFWQEVGLNAWNICEGGHAHSGLDDFEQHMQRYTDAVTAVGFPIDPNLFDELRAAESKLGPVEQGYETVSEEQVGPLDISMQFGGTTRRDGFEILRDIITRYRRQWAEQHLDHYLQARWRQELEAVGAAYHRHAADRAKPPTVKQFAGMAKDAASHWFAGDLTGVYGALGLTLPMAPPSYERILPADVRAVQRRVEMFLRETLATQSGQLQEHQSETVKWGSMRLAHYASDWVELYEALGEPPELKQFGTPRFRNACGHLWDDLDEAWLTFSQLVQSALAELSADAPASHSVTAPPPAANEPPQAPLASAVPHLPRQPETSAPESDRGKPPASGTSPRRRGLLQKLFRS